MKLLGPVETLVPFCFPNHIYTTPGVVYEVENGGLDEWVKFAKLKIGRLDL